MGKFLAILATIGVGGAVLLAVEGEKEEYCLWTIDKKTRRRCAFSCGPSRMDMQSEKKRYFSHSKNLDFEISKTKKRQEVFCS